ncbi:MAG TPA: hypothetical protein VJM31_17370 [Vicinamibacterales bacterium]|nr:hypothetical protein [Vicinamibacterales bacterium]
MKKVIASGLVVGAVFVAACASNPARSSVAVPLVIPEPPPRVEIAPVPSAEAPLPERPMPAAVPAAKTSPPTSTPAANGTAASSAPPQAAAVTVPEPPRTTPAPELRPGGPAGRMPTATQVRERLSRTKQKLDRIDRRNLNVGKRADYDSAQRFLAQAEGAARDNNLLLAESSVEKAETLADGLR